MRPDRVQIESVPGAGPSSNAELPSVFAAALASRPSSKRHSRRIVVEVGIPPVQRRHLSDLPPMSRKHLRAAVRYQALRFFRDSGHGLVTDACWVGSRGQGRPAVAVALDASVATDIVRVAGESGVKVLDIVPLAEGIPLRLSLLPAREREVRARASWGHTYKVAALTFLLGISATGALVGNRLAVSHAVEEELHALQGPMAAVRLARASMDTARATITALEGERRRRGDLLAALVRLSEVIPDSAVITSALVRRDGALEVTGFAKEPLGVVAALQRTGAWPALRLAGSPVLESAGGRTWARLAMRSEGAP